MLAAASVSYIFPPRLANVGNSEIGPKLVLSAAGARDQPPAGTRATPSRRGTDGDPDCARGNREQLVAAGKHARCRPSDGAACPTADACGCDPRGPRRRCGREQLGGVLRGRRCTNGKRGDERPLFPFDPTEPRNRRRGGLGRRSSRARPDLELADRAGKLRQSVPAELTARKAGLAASGWRRSRGRRPGPLRRRPGVHLCPGGSGRPGSVPIVAGVARGSCR